MSYHERERRLTRRISYLLLAGLALAVVMAPLFEPRHSKESTPLPYQLIVHLCQDIDGSGDCSPTEPAISNKKVDVSFSNSDIVHGTTNNSGDFDTSFALTNNIQLQPTIDGCITSKPIVATNPAGQITLSISAACK